MTDHASSFEPSAARASALDVRMRNRLAQSADYVFEQVGDDLGIDLAIAKNACGDIREKTQSPHRFGNYYELVIALEQDDLDEARTAANEFLNRKSITRATELGTIEDRPTEETARYRRLLIDDPSMTAEPDPDLKKEYWERLGNAFELLGQGFPEIAAEIRGLLREIVVAAGPKDPKALTFDGSSSYQMWGAVLLNARGQKTVLDCAQALAHESGHNLLFGLCTDGPLVENPDDELFKSPLRKDARPMDGVFHATYVIARMHQTLTRLIEAGALSDEQMVAAQKDLALHEANFHGGDDVVREGAILTDVGRAAIEAARAYMASANRMGAAA